VRAVARTLIVLLLAAGNLEDRCGLAENGHEPRVTAGFPRPGPAPGRRS